MRLSESCTNKFGNDWKFKIDKFFQHCEMTIVRYVQVIYRRLSNQTAGAFATMEMPTLPESQSWSMKPRKGVLAATPADTSNERKRKPPGDQGGKMPKQHRGPYLFKLCHTCGNYHGELSECFYRNHPDANNNPQIKWQDSASEKIYIIKKGLSEVPTDRNRAAKAHRRGLQWGQRINGGEIMVDSMVQRQPKCKQALITSPITSYFTYDCHVYRADKHFNTTVILDTGSLAKNFVSDRLVRKIIRIGCDTAPSRLELCSCTGQCTVCRSCYFLNLSINIPTRAQPITIENQPFHVLPGLPTDMLLGATTIHELKILEQLIQPADHCPMTVNTALV